MKTKRLLRILLFGGVFLLFAGGKFWGKTETPYELKIPTGYPKPQIPDDNALTKEKIALGKLLFYDKNLSKDRSVSCASCHRPEFSFSDNKPLSSGVSGTLGTRNAMPLINLAWVNMFLWDGGVPTLEQQAIKPLTNSKEMNITLLEAEARVSENPKYLKLFRAAFGKKPDYQSIIKALASFERTLVSGESKFDKFYYQKNAMAYSDSEIRGYYLFMGSRMHCSSCHVGPNLGQSTFENNGLYEVYTDEGRAAITGDKTDVGKFKVPTLRNIALTAPYMHDGSIGTLEGVIRHYVSGGKNHPNKSMHVHFPEEPPINDSQIQDLVHFLNALTDETFINNKDFLPNED